MTYKGHVENGVVVLDDPTRLPEGAEVRIEFVTAPQHPAPELLSLRGLPYRFDDALSPAVPDSDWEPTA